MNVQPGMRWNCSKDARHNGWRPDWPAGTRCPKCGEKCSGRWRKPTRRQYEAWLKEVKR